jgi:hypothetical protein
LIREAGLKNGHGGFFAILINERGIGREENKLSSGMDLLLMVGGRLAQAHCGYDGTTFSRDLE